MHRTTIKGDYGLGRWETEPRHVETADTMTMQIVPVDQSRWRPWH